MNDLYYVKGRGNLAVTVFVPWDCKNDCAFGMTKQLYKKVKPNLPRLLGAIYDIRRSAPHQQGAISDFVLTGGEPFAKLDGLAAIIDNAPERLRVYINTAMPDSMFDNTPQLGSIMDRVDGISVSIRMSDNFKAKAEKLKMLDRWRDKVRVNCVVEALPVPDELFKAYTEAMLFKCSYVSFRADNRAIATLTELKSMDDLFFRFLAGKGVYKGSSGCQVCNDDRFTLDNQLNVSYHRGMKYTSIRLPRALVVNDIVVFPDAYVSLDWWPEPCKDMQECVIDLFARGFVNGEDGLVRNNVEGCPLKGRKVVYERLDTCHGTFYEPLKGGSCPYKLAAPPQGPAPMEICGKPVRESVRPSCGRPYSCG